MPAIIGVGGGGCGETQERKLHYIIQTISSGLDRFFPRFPFKCSHMKRLCCMWHRIAYKMKVCG